MKFFDRRKQKKYYRELLAIRKNEDDLLSAAEKESFDALLAAIQCDPDPRHAVEVAQAKMKHFPLHGNYGNLRNLLDLLVVVGAVAFGLRALFFQPFRIPTSSMQPTLYGVHYRTGLPKCNKFLKAIVYGAREAKATTRSAGMLSGVQYVAGLFDCVRFTIGGDTYELPGDVKKITDYAGLSNQKFYAANTTLADGDLVIGDHLFVERLSLYWREPQRGDVMVFTTDGLAGMNGQPLAESGGAYYIKRLVALPGDTIKLENNQLYVRPKGKDAFVPVQQLDPRFEKVYSGKGGYQGHNSDMNGIVYGKNEYTIPDRHYFMLGDNSAFSGDSRFFGPVPRKNLVGRAFVCFWPLSRRTGLIDRKGPIDEPTGKPMEYTFPVMWKQ